MKLLINTSNLKKGGALQVAHSFLYEICLENSFEFHVILSSSLQNQIETEKFPSNFIFYFYTLNPSIYNAFSGHVYYLTKLEKLINPDCTFTIFGPSYWIPKSSHLMGFAIPHYLYPESPFFRINKIGAIIFRLFKLNFIKYIHQYNLKKSNAIFWTETEDVSNRLANFLKLDRSLIFTISNTCHSSFNRYLESPIKKNKKNKKNKTNHIFSFIIITADYPHKNLEILKKVIAVLRNRQVSCKFYLTINDTSYKKFEGFEDYILNLGPVAIEKCPELYDAVDSLFLPTLLECFSASYPEAMKMGKPILTSDLSFAHDICGEAAEYFDPLNPVDIANKIELIIKNKKRREELIQAGYKQLQKFETASSRAQKYLDICQRIALKK